MLANAPALHVALTDRDDVALVEGSSQLTYAELTADVERRAAEFDIPARSVVVLTGANSLEWVVTYLAVQRAGHVPLLATGDTDRLIARWQPAAVVDATALGWTIDRFDAEPIVLHPDLALLMSTSGSTGSPKLVRLSATNLRANAASIADFQRLTSADRGITNLPLHYSMGLSVLHSHLAVGASLVVTDGSVVDRSFAAAMHEHGVTNLAGVPGTFELLDQVGPERIHVPTLRFLAQAGGRMAPERVAAWAERASRWGADWFTMYGATEATARMSYVPPAMIREHPGTIGVAIGGGELSIDGDDGEFGGVGEIVYRGPNVMLGYATDVSELGRGRDITELRTGDLGRVDPSTGLFEVVGRRSRRVKPFGLRVDLDDVEQRLVELGITAHVAGDDEVIIAAAPGSDPDEVVAAMATVTGLPARRLQVLTTPAPRLDNGKPDYATMVATAHRATEIASAENFPGAVDKETSDEVERQLLAAFSTVLGRHEIRPDSSFVSLGGDSLSYVECSIRVERILGRLPTGWHLAPIASLAAPVERGKLARVDTTVVLRAVAILAVVSTHMRLRHVPGGAHLLLGVVGFNLARFMMPIEQTRDRVRAGLRTVARVAIPTMAWTAALMLAGQYTWTTLSLANNYVGPRSHAGNHWHFWFIEVFVHLVLVTTLLMAIPAVRRLDRRWPYAFPLALLGPTIALRLDWADMGDWYNLRFRTHAVAWFFVLGWLVQRSSTVWQRLVTTAICLAAAPGVFMNPQREFFIALGLVLLVWVKEVPLPRPVVRPVATVAAASMWILISHFMIWPPMMELFAVEVAYPLTVLVSIAVWWTFVQAPRLASRLVLDPRVSGRVAGRVPFLVPPARAAVNSL